MRLVSVCPTASTSESHTTIGVDRARDGRAIAVLDLERAALLRGSGRVRGIVRALLAARRARARGRGHPEVRRTRVEVDQEVGWGRPNADYTSPLRVVPDVHERLALAAIKVARCLLEGRDGGNVLGETASVLLEIDECLTVLAEA